LRLCERRADVKDEKFPKFGISLVLERPLVIGNVASRKRNDLECHAALQEQYQLLECYDIVANDSGLEESCFY